MPSVSLGDVNIYYESRGSGLPIVLIPGLSMDGSAWDEVADRLVGEFTVITVDNRGAGLSDTPRGSYSIETMAEDIRALCAGLNIEEVVFVGHSMGGFIALELALDSVELVGGLVLVSTSPTGRPGETGATRQVKNVLRRTKGPVEEIVAETMEVGLGQRIHDENPAAIERFIEKRVARPPKGIGYLGQSVAASAFDVRARLHEIRCPCFVIHGREDQFFSVERGEELASGIEGAKLTLLERVGHFPQIEAPVELVQEILECSQRLIEQKN